MRWVPVLVLAVALPATAQVGFRGDETGERGFDYTSRYFLDVFAYRLTDRLREPFDQASTGYVSTIGSLRSDESYVFQHAKIGVPFQGPFERMRFSFNYLQSEDFDSRFRETRLELSAGVLDWLDVGPVAQIDPNKGDDDFGAIATAHTRDGEFVCLSWLFEGALRNEKGKPGEGRFGTHPGTIGLRAGTAPTGAWGADLFAYSILPLSEKFENPDTVFRMEKTDLGGHVRGTLGETTHVRIESKLELAKKWNEYAPPSNPGERRLARRAVSVVAEMEHPLRDDIASHLGLRYFALRENDRFPNDDPKTANLRRRDHTLFVGVELEIVPERVTFDPTVFVNLANNATLSPGGSQHEREAQVKLTLPFCWQVSTRFSFVLNPTLDVDEGRFGGGDIQLVATF